MIPISFQAGLWDLLAGSALVLGTIAGFYIKLNQQVVAGIMAMIPEAFENGHNYSGLITVLGFLAAFKLTKIGR